MVFVYGTLKRGHGNHHWLAGAPFQGDVELTGVVLHDLGPFPMAVTGEGTVRGEVYAVDAAGLARLDRLEGYPRLYDRRPLPLADGRRAWVYLGRAHQVRHVSAIADGCWLGPAPGAALRRSQMGLAVMLVAGGVALLSAVLPCPALALDTLASCNAWRGSRGTARILLGNSIGAAHYLTKMQRLQDSSADAPVALYSDSDLQRACGGR
ncbi:gamma-glutamylcyclotransferase [Synechococcus sp. CS-1332]|nr:gamma-glutamylcyclotransferase [Synechococcus sp. CS-1332]